MTLENKLSQFLGKHWDGQSPLLLALSGGPDSLMLLQLLLKLQKYLHFDLAVAHVDHRWRTSSEAEAQFLEEKVSNLGLRFHLKVLSPQELTGNLEAACRFERHQFFRELCSQYGYQAVLLGHHADDQAETVLKRIFEGTSLPYLTALRTVAIIDQLTLWRPLLDCWKSELIEALKFHDIEPIIDETNQDPKYLRARFRTKLLPLLSVEFGKEINTHLKNLSLEAQELSAYLDEKIAENYSKLLKGPFGAMLDLKEIVNTVPFLELKHLIRRFCRDAHLLISREALRSAVDFLVKGAANKSLSCGDSFLYIDRYCLFAIRGCTEINAKKLAQQKAFDLSPNFLNKPEVLELTLGDHFFGMWKVSVEKFDAQIPSESCYPTVKTRGWRDVWTGRTSALLPFPSKILTLEYPKPGDCYPHSSPINQWWNKAKIPLFMRSLLPVVFCEGKIVHEFLTGKIKQQQPTLRVTLDVA